MRRLLALAAVVVVPTAGAASGRELFVEGCSSCHGLDARGVEGVAPTLRGVGERSADFYLSTGRMPMEDPTEQPIRSRPAYSGEEIDALVEYVGSFGGPPIPEPQPERGDLARGLKLFSDQCMACHQIVGEGGVVTEALAPPLDEATPRQIAEAVRIGPYVMPAFDEDAISDRDLDDLIRYVVYTRDPDDRGGWPIGHIGPIPEGMVAWLIGAAALVAVAVAVGERLR